MHSDRTKGVLAERSHTIQYRRPSPFFQITRRSNKRTPRNANEILSWRWIKPHTGWLGWRLVLGLWHLGWAKAGQHHFLYHNSQVSSTISSLLSPDASTFYLALQAHTYHIWRNRSQLSWRCGDESLIQRA